MDFLNKKFFISTTSGVTLVPCTSVQLNLDVVLTNGQTFRWHSLKCNDKENSTERSKSWIGVMKSRIWKVWRADKQNIAFEVLHIYLNEDTRSDLEIFCEYFNIKVDLEVLYHKWTNADPYFAKITSMNGDLKGIRVLKQPSFETLISFICSSNNNIKRITGMVGKFCELYGSKCPCGLNEFDETLKLNDFPSIPHLYLSIANMESTLRKAGFGYRATYIKQTVEALSRNFEEYGGGEKWLESLKSYDYSFAKKQLMKLPGVGPKVADCVCLMGLSMNEVVPIDTHVFQITKEVYKPDFLKPLMKKNSIPKNAYDKIVQFYINLFGDYAGWAQSILFSTRIKLRS